MKRRDKHIYRIVISDEGRFSILPAGTIVPPGWRDAGNEDLKKCDCLTAVLIAQCYSYAPSWI
jgi:uncharacterized protein YbdZ (MbtH family)